MTPRTVWMTLPATMMDMDGLSVRQALPNGRIQQLDPFLLLHHAGTTIPPERKPAQAGVGPHPHRGFSPVTFIFKGGVHHRDSRGNDSVVYAGGAQWMHAGMGIVHSERPPPDIQERGGVMEIVQLWVNTPGSHKMDQPAYFAVAPDNAPLAVLDDGKVSIRTFAGEVLGLKGPVRSHTAVNAATLDLKAGGTVEIPLPATHNVLLYLLDGQLTLPGDRMASGLHAVTFNHDGDSIALRADQDTRALLLSGQPIGEEVVSFGPYVMNTQTQILEAMRDYQMGRMGILIEE